jgi:Zn-dependent protease
VHGISPLEGGEEFTEIEKIIENYFIINDYYVSHNVLIFRVSSKGVLKDDFLKLYNEIKSLGYMPLLDKEGEDIEIHVVKYKSPEKKKSNKPILLLLATLGTVMIDGYWRSLNPYLKYTMQNYDPLLMTIFFTVAIMSIIGIHELGHKIALAIYNIRASWPYFIPGIPSIFPTFGAIITQEEVPPNRDRLFDTGIAGPIAGLVASLIVAIFAVMNAPIVPISELEALKVRLGGELVEFPIPILYYILQETLRPVKPGYVILIDPLTWAAIVGFLITALNIFPAWQLDGGHLARAVLGPRQHRIATLISILILFWVGYFFMAIFILLMHTLSGGATVRPLDDVSKVSPARKALFIITWIIAIVCLPFPQFP